MYIPIKNLLAIDVADIEDELIWIDHRDEEQGLLQGFNEYLEEEDHLVCKWRDEHLDVFYRNQKYGFPFTVSRHDRYVAISSFAELVKDKYSIYLFSEGLEDDTHGLYLARNTDISQLDEPDKQKFLAIYEPLKLGHDYFNGIDVPYLNNEDNNPNFLKEAQAIETQRQEFRKVMRETFAQGVNKKKPWWKFW